MSIILSGIWNPKGNSGSVLVCGFTTNLCWKISCLLCLQVSLRLPGKSWDSSLESPTHHGSSSITCPAFASSKSVQGGHILALQDKEGYQQPQCSRDKFALLFLCRCHLLLPLISIHKTDGDSVSCFDYVGWYKFPVHHFHHQLKP